MINNSTVSLRDYLRQGPFSLALSSGFFGFFAHCGFISVLEEEGLVPTRVTGSSAGALIGALWSSGLDASMIRRELAQLSRVDFWDPGPGVGLLQGRRFLQKLDEVLPVKSFQQCRYKLALSVFDVLACKTVVLEKGDLSAAILASCAVPFLFQPIRVNRRWCLDGGIRDRPGLVGMPKTERVLYHHLVSGSPWRRSKLVGVPKRLGMAYLAIEGLPRVGPFRLHQGMKSYHHAVLATRKALEQKVNLGL